MDVLLQLCWWCCYSCVGGAGAATAIVPGVVWVQAGLRGNRHKLLERARVAYL